MLKWVKQGDQLVRCRIDRRNVGPLETIAIEAGPRQVFEGCFASVFFGNNVIRFMGKIRIRLR